MKKILVGICAVVLASICVIVFSLSGDSGTYYYSQIDNSKLEEGKSDGGVIDFNGRLPYAYTLASYDENGNEKEIRFGTSRELKEGALIRLTVVPLRGAIAWEELRYDELPPAVQRQYASPE